MRFLAPILLALSLLFSPVSPALAFAEDEDSSSSSKTDLIRERFEEKLNKLQTKTAEKKVKLESRMATKEARVEANASAAAKVKEMRQENIKKFGTNMVERLNAMVRRLEKLIIRIESRLEKIKTTGKDVSSIQAQVDSAKTKLDKAKSDISALSASLDSLASSETAKDEFTRVRTQVKNIVSELKEVHRMLVRVIGQMKGLRVGNASPSPVATP